MLLFNPPATTVAMPREILQNAFTTPLIAQNRLQKSWQNYHALEPKRKTAFLGGGGGGGGLKAMEIFDKIKI